MTIGKQATIKAEFHNSEKGSTSHASYKFDVVAQNAKKQVFIHKNVSESNGESEADTTAFVQPICPVRVGESIMIQVPLFDPSGNFFDYNVNSEVKFHPIQIQEVREQYSFFAETEYVKPDLV